MEIDVDTITQAHYTLIRTILNHGEFVTTEDGEQTVELYTPLTVIISKPHIQPHFITETGHTKEYYREYGQQMVHNKSNPGFTYTYGERLRNYAPYNIDQLAVCMDLLKRNPTTRRAIAHTYKVYDDICSKAPPCLQTVQFMIRDDKVNIVASFRSNDMLSAWGCNVYGLLMMMDYACEELYLNEGSITTVSTNPHIYYKRDRNIIEALHKVIPINMERLYGRNC